MEGIWPKWNGIKRKYRMSNQLWKMWNKKGTRIRVFCCERRLWCQTTLIFVYFHFMFMFFFFVSLNPRHFWHCIKVGVLRILFPFSLAIDLTSSVEFCCRWKPASVMYHIGVHLGGHWKQESGITDFCLFDSHYSCRKPAYSDFSIYLGLS